MNVEYWTMAYCTVHKIPLCLHHVLQHFNGHSYRIKINKMKNILNQDIWTYKPFHLITIFFGFSLLHRITYFVLSVSPSRYALSMCVCTNVKCARLRTSHENLFWQQPTDKTTQNQWNVCYDKRKERKIIILKTKIANCHFKHSFIWSTSHCFVYLFSFSLFNLIILLLIVLVYLLDMFCSHRTNETKNKMSGLNSNSVSRAVY